MNEEEEHREKMIDRKWGLLDAIAQGYCQNPEFACTAYQPLADMIVRTANAVAERILQDPPNQSNRRYRERGRHQEQNEDDNRSSY